MPVARGIAGAPPSAPSAAAGPGGGAAMRTEAPCSHRVESDRKADLALSEVWNVARTRAWHAATTLHRASRIDHGTRSSRAAPQSSRQGLALVSRHGESPLSCKSAHRQNRWPARRHIHSCERTERARGPPDPTQAPQSSGKDSQLAAISKWRTRTVELCSLQDGRSRSRRSVAATPTMHYRDPPDRDRPDCRTARPPCHHRSCTDPSALFFLAVTSAQLTVEYVEA